MIKGLWKCPLSYAIPVDREVHSSWVEQFWTKAKTKKDGPKITLKIDGLDVVVNEEVIRKALQIKDNVADPFTTFSKEEIDGYLKGIGYDTVWVTCIKKHLPVYWKLLCHIIANCLSSHRGGFDKFNVDWVGVMICLTKKKK